MSISGPAASDADPSKLQVRRWHEAPEPLLDLPDSLTPLRLNAPSARAARGAPRRAAVAATASDLNARDTAPSHAAVQETPCKRKKRKTTLESDSLDFLDSCARQEARVGRCRYRLADGRIAALPLRPSVIDKSFQGDESELVLIELASPSPDSLPWLEDPDVDVVMVGDVLIDRPRLRQFTLSRVPLQPCVRTLARAVFTCCRPLYPSPYLATLFPIEVLQALQD